MANDRLRSVRREFDGLRYDFADPKAKQVIAGFRSNITRLQRENRRLRAEAEGLRVEVEALREALEKSRGDGRGNA